MPPAASPAIDSASGDRENPGGFVHIPALDGVRGIAILLVLFDHFFWANSNTGNPIFDLISQVRSASYVGVNLFFALSGFLITGILIDTIDVPHYFRTFYARRTLRIFPLYYGFLLLILMLTKPLHLVWSGWQYYYLTYTSNLAVARHYSPLELGYFNINHFWSLQVEEQFYLVWPLVVYRVRKAVTIVRISVIGCAAVLGVRIFLVLMRHHPGFENPYLPYSPTFSCADNILYGCCLCALLRTSRREAAMRVAPRVLAVSATVLLLVGIFNHGLRWDNDSFLPGRLFIPTIGFSIVGIGCAAVIAMALRPGSQTQRFFQSGALRFFGRYSYGIYVFHYSIFGSISGPLRLYFNNHFHSKALSILLVALIASGLTVLAALISYRFFESPILRLKRYFSYNSIVAA
jgi:peptidoglycan/LPS O-acetylase OafA/YrhL